MRLFLVVVVVGVAFSAACFLERLLRDYAQPSSEPSDVTGSLPKWLNRNLGAKDRGKEERRTEPRTTFMTVARQPKLISQDEVRRIAVNLARLPELLMAQPH
jgi:hypothetical protein